MCSTLLHMATTSKEFSKESTLLIDRMLVLAFDMEEEQLHASLLFTKQCAYYFHGQ